MMYSLVIGLIALLFLAAALAAVGGTDKSKKKEAIWKDLKECRSLMKGNASARKDCLIRIDVLLGKSMEFAGVRGKTVGEKLKNADKLFKWDLYQKLWEGHKLRNRVVHENEQVSGSELRSTVKYFTAAIKRLLK